ncbi:protein kinase domain-containing protein [Terrisporobacter sp.]
MEYIAKRYEILDADNQFIFGKLYKARDLNEGIIVFIQLIEDNKYVNQRFLPNLIDESTMLLNINSPHIAKILDIGIHLTDEERYYYIVSEYFSGINLRRIIKGNYMDLNSIVNITKKILTALKTSYSHNLYHGSLSEDNIFVDENYNIKIYDFCLTQANRGVNIRKNNHRGFLSPHQLSINFTDMESDFFSLGVILFDSIFKKMPFGIGKDEEDMLKLIDKGIDWNSVAINNENIALVNIVKKLIRRTEKYSGVDEILIDLSKFMYVKADIEPKDMKISEIENDDISLNKTDNKFIQKLILLALTIIVLAAVISQFK